MKPDPHKQKSTREWKKKHGIYQKPNKKTIIPDQAEIKSLEDDDIDYENQESEFQNLISTKIHENDTFQFKHELAASNATSKLLHATNQIIYFHLDISALKNYYEHFSHSPSTESDAIKPSNLFRCSIKIPEEYSKVLVDIPVENLNLKEYQVMNAPLNAEIPIAKQTKNDKHETIDEWLNDLL